MYFDYFGLAESKNWKTAKGITTTMQKMARRHNKEGGNRLEQESNRQKTMEDSDGGLHPSVDGQNLGEIKEQLFTELKNM